MPVQTSPDQSNFELIKIGIQAAGYVIGWIIVVVGWLVSNNQNRHRDERKDLRDRVNEIAKLIKEVEGDVVDFLIKEDEGSGAFWTVHFGVSRVNLAIVAMPTFDTENVKDALIGYRQAITGRAINGPTSKPANEIERERALRQVSKAGSVLIRSLENRFGEVFPLKRRKIE